MGITQKALAAGVPLCVVPFGRDQLETAGHVLVCEAGTRVIPELLRPRRLHAAIHEAIARRPGAERVAAGFAAAGGAHKAAEALERLASTNLTTTPPSRHRR